jgi:D-alanine-D-alanine ligase
MKVGITYDLRNDYLAQGMSAEATAEFDAEETIESIENAVKACGYMTERIGNIKQLAGKLVSGERWDMVFNICEGLYGISREAQVPALLDAYNIPYVFSDPMVLALTLHKGMTKRVVRDLNVPTPGFAVIEHEDEFSSVDLDFPLFVKPVAEGTSKGIGRDSKIINKKDLQRIGTALLRQYQQPVLVEEYLPGREFTVGITGTGRDACAIGAMEIILKDRSDSAAYSYSNKANYETMVSYTLAEDADARHSIAIALDAWRGLGCRDGGRIDIRLDKNGVPNFIEVNPLAGLHPVNSDIVILSKMKGIEYQELIQRIMDSALKRISSSQKPLPLSTTK